MTDRRYSEREIRAVFERAAREQEAARADRVQDGLTLAEMQEVAASAGIAPEFVEQAARSVSLGDPEEGLQRLGPIPRGVSRTQILPAPPTAALWEDLVGDCQELFEARGSVRQTGRVREWRNGNLRATLEPLGDGSRLRLQTRRDGVTAQLFGLGLVLIAAIALTVGAGGLSNAGLWAGLLVIAGLGGAGLWASQHAWATTRASQFQALAERALVRTQPPPVARATASPARLAPTGLADADEEAADARASSSGRRRTRS